MISYILLFIFLLVEIWLHVSLKIFLYRKYTKLDVFLNHVYKSKITIKMKRVVKKKIKKKQREYNTIILSSTNEIIHN